MKVTLLNYTKEAKAMLVFTKLTRRMSDASGWEEIRNWPEERLDEELDHVFKTISGPLEFIDYTFFIEGVTRAFTHQLVRHRVGTSFAQQSQRIAKMDGFRFTATGAADDSRTYFECMGMIGEAYEKMLEEGVPTQDARGVLPTNICTCITFKCNLRTLADMMGTRLCVRTQGEFQDVAKEMRKLVVDVHPFTERCLRVTCLKTGACIFPDFHECPLKEAHPDLQPDADKLDGYVEDWEGIIGHSVQPT